jgi:hypothetical protein
MNGRYATSVALVNHILDFSWPFPSAFTKRRVHLPVTRTPPVDLTGLPELLAASPNIKVQLLNAFNGTDPLRGLVGRRLIEQTRVTIDISHIEGQGGVGKLIAGWRQSVRSPGCPRVSKHEPRK